MNYYISHATFHLFKAKTLQHQVTVQVRTYLTLEFPKLLNLYPSVRYLPPIPAELVQDVSFSSEIMSWYLQSRHFSWYVFRMRLLTLAYLDTSFPMLWSVIMSQSVSSVIFVPTAPQKGKSETFSAYDYVYLDMVYIEQFQKVIFSIQLYLVQLRMDVWLGMVWGRKVVGISAIKLDKKWNCSH